MRIAALYAAHTLLEVLGSHTDPRGPGHSPGLLTVWGGRGAPSARAQLPASPGSRAPHPRAPGL